MEHKNFGKTREKVFVIGLGTYGHGDAYGGISKNQSFSVFKSILGRFPNSAKVLVDTAPRYGNGKVEGWIGEFLEILNKEKFLIATKGGRHIERGRINEKDFTKSFIERDLNDSLRRLKLNQIFLYQLHNPSLDIIKGGSIFESLEDLSDEGKIMFYGLSIDTPEEGMAALDICKDKGFTNMASLQIIYNVLWKNSYDELFKKAEKSKVAIIAREPLFRGFLTGKYKRDENFLDAPEAVKKQITSYGAKQIFLKLEEVKNILNESNLGITLSQLAISFAVSNPKITVTIPGINRIGYVEEDINAAYVKINEKTLNMLKSLKDIDMINK